MSSAYFDTAYFDTAYWIGNTESTQSFSAVSKKLTIGMVFDITYFDETYFECLGSNLMGVIVKK